MELNVHESTRIVEVWMTSAEKNDPVIQAKMKELYAEYKEKKYTIAVFQSGSGELYQSTHDLLAYNEKKRAELAVQQVKPTKKAAGMER